MELIEDSERTSVSQALALTIVTEESFELLENELKAPKYGAYRIVVTGPITPAMIKKIAMADVHKVVSDVVEAYINAYHVDDCLYTLEFSLPQIKDGEVIENSALTEGNELVEQKIPLKILSSLKMGTQSINFSLLHSFLLSLRISPGIFISKSFDCIELRKELKSFQENLENFKVKKEGTLIIINRTEDVITPLLHTWTYQAMIHEYLDSFDKILTLEEKTFSLNDEFYQRNRFKDIKTLASSLKDFVDKKMKISTEISAIEETNSQSKSLETHLFIYNQLMNACIKNKTVSELESKILRDDIDVEELIDKMEQKEISEDQATKLIIILILKKNLLSSSSGESFSANYQQKIKQPAETSDEDENNAGFLNNLMTKIKNKLNTKSSQLSKLQSSFSTVIKKLEQLKIPKQRTLRFLDDVDPKLGTLPRVHTALKKHLKSKDYFQKIIERKTEEPIVLYFQGGITHTEHLHSVQVMKKYKKKVYILADKIISQSDLLNELTK